jgi:TusE/DsrC/DsvC family sulfur relay protein
MSIIFYGNKTIEVDRDGFMNNLEEWDEDVAREIAKKEGLNELGPSRLEILMVLREYYRKFSSFPILSYVCKKAHAASRNCITDEFVDPMKAWKIAGLPKPPQVFFTSFDGKHYFANPFY